MAPGRVFAVPPGGSKRILEVEDHVPARVTRQKAKAVAAAINEESHPQDNQERSLQMMDDEGSTARMDFSPVRMEPSHVGMDLSPLALLVDRDTSLEQTEQETQQAAGDEGKFLYL